MQSVRGQKEKLRGLGGNDMWDVVKIMVPFWVPIILRHLKFRVPKRDHSFDIPPCAFSSLGPMFQQLTHPSQKHQKQQFMNPNPKP